MSKESKLVELLSNENKLSLDRKSSNSTNLSKKMDSKRSDSNITSF